MKSIAKLGFLVIVIANLLLLSGCSEEPDTLSTWYVFHSGTDSKEINLKEGDEVSFKYKSTTLMGKLTMTLVDPDGEVVHKMESLEEGESSYKADHEGAYKVIVENHGSTGRYSINWEID